MRVLVVSDAPDAAAVVHRSLGCDLPERALDGGSALTMVERAHAEGDPFDMVCTALGLRDMDGYLLLKCLRVADARAGTDAYTTVWMLTSTEAGRALVSTERRPRDLDAHLHLPDGQLTRSWSRYARISLGVQSAHCA